jgi:hypothetical protein
MTPGTIANYWPGTERLTVLRKHWHSYREVDWIIERINRLPAPKPVTIWQCRLMASHLHVTRPADFNAHVRLARRLRAYRCLHPDERAELQELRERAMWLQFTTSNNVMGRPQVEARPEAESHLRRVGRKPKRKTKVRGFATGLTAGRSTRAAVSRAAKRRSQAKSKAKRKSSYIPAAKRKDAKSKVSTIWRQSPKYIPSWFVPLD